jgi:flagellar basal-body rod protein FlgC
MKRTTLWLAALSLLFAMCQGQEYVHGGEREKYYTMLESQVKDTSFVKFLRDRGIKLETDSNGLLRIYVHGKTETFPTIVKFLDIMKTRMMVLAGNLANANTTRPANVNPYRRKDIVIDQDGNASVVIDQTSPLKRYIPSHPHADKEGYVLFPNISASIEIVSLDQALQEYNLAESLLERCLPGNYIPNRLGQGVMRMAGHFVEIGENRDRLDRIEIKLDALKPVK